MKKLFSILLVLAIVLSMIPMNVFANEAEPAAEPAPVAAEPAPADPTPAAEPAPAAAEQTDAAPASDAAADSAVDTAAQQPSSSDTKTEEPKTEDVKTEETKTEQTKAEEPAAEETTLEAEEPSFSVAGHTDHCACGNADLGVCTTHTCETITTWTALTQSNQSTYFNATNLAAGTYSLVLTEDIEVTAQMNVGENCTVNLCLNGHTILVKGAKRAFNVYQASTLNIADCVGSDIRLRRVIYCRSGGD